MHHRLVFALAVALAACSGDEGDPPKTDSGAAETGGDTAETVDTFTTSGQCGAITRHDLTLVGKVVLASGGDAVGAEVWIEDRGWSPQVEVLGAATTDEAGAFTLPITGLTSAEDCWGTLLDYVVVAELGIQRGERAVNQPLYNAILDGTLQADIAASPIAMEDTSL